MYINVSDIGGKIKYLRESNSYTQETFAEQFNISRRYLSKIESGERCPSIELLVDFSECFQITLDYLILGKNGSNAHIKNKLQKIILSLIALESEIPPV